MNDLERYFAELDEVLQRSAQLLAVLQPLVLYGPKVQNAAAQLTLALAKLPERESASA